MQLLGNGHSNRKTNFLKPNSSKSGKASSIAIVRSTQPSTDPSAQPSAYPSVPCGGPCADDGLCEDIQKVTPCVAVIDEWDNRDFSAEWANFRTQYPKRPFCLLVPYSSYSNGKIRLPDGFDGDTVNNPDGIDRTTYAHVNRDESVTSQASDWFQICGLSKYEAATDFNFIGAFIDVSTSLTFDTVYASAALFARKLRCAGLSTDYVFNAHERWLDPFFVSLKPPEGTTECGGYAALCAPGQTCNESIGSQNSFCDGPISVDECTPTAIPSAAPSFEQRQRNRLRESFFQTYPP
eukprot:scaffold5903_cov81-Skeletonema_menzelii.AAC.4